MLYPFELRAHVRDKTHFKRSGGVAAPLFAGLLEQPSQIEFLGWSCIGDELSPLAL
jgi:hypothetical protein